MDKKRTSKSIPKNKLEIDVPHNVRNKAAVHALSHGIARLQRPYCLKLIASPLPLLHLRFRHHRIGTVGRVQALLRGRAARADHRQATMVIGSFTSSWC